MKIVNMARLITQGRVALFEYPSGATDPTFTLEKDGVLWIDGFNIPIFPDGHPVRACKRFETKLTGYTCIGKYSGSHPDIIEKAGIDKDRCIMFIKDPA